MASMNRVRVAWSNFAGQPGLTTFFLGDSKLDVTPIKNFFTAMAPFVPAGTTWTIPALGDKIIDTDGSIGGSWSGVGGGTVVATGLDQNFSGASGFCIDWLTITINNRRRIQGRTFIVPAASGVYQNNGTIVEATRTTIAAAGQALISALSPDFLVWSRPFPGRAASAGPPPVTALPARPGTSGPAAIARVPDLAAVLRSRRS
jgi:hypothetical protein